MMTCSDCGTNLDRVPVGVSCPNCDSLRRDATVSATTNNTADLLHPPEIFEEDGGEVAANQAEALTTAMSVEGILAEPVDALLSRDDVRKVAEAGQLVLRYNPPTDEATAWVVQAWQGDELISMASGEKFADAYLAMGEQIEDHLAADD
jgi:uncharacterized Zn finger protein (UPF0148 family)